ncbi:MAG: glycogen-binding domain-containing protein [Verrucomicrobiota bacterium]
MRLYLLLLLTAFVVRADDDIATTFTYADPAATTVEVAGEFNNWKTVPLAKDAAGNWTKTLFVKPGTYAYKLVINGEWKFDPKNPARKTVNEIENSAITVGGPAPVATGTLFTYTDTKAKSVHLAGDFNKWLDNVAGKVTGKDEWLLQNDGAGNWKLTKEVPPGRYQFKYVIDGGDRWEKDPTKPTEGDNSVIEILIAAAPAAGNASFACAAPTAKTVTVAGEFNKWNATANPLQKDAAGLWTTTLSLKPGKYPYKFVVDGNWQTDPTAAETADDGLGGKNSVKVVNP